MFCFTFRMIFYKVLEVIVTIFSNLFYPFDTIVFRAATPFSTFRRTVWSHITERTLSPTINSYKLLFTIILSAQSSGKRKASEWLHAMLSHSHASLWLHSSEMYTL